MELVEFLLARIGEDEEWARASASPDYSDAEPGTPAHSSRILAECEAKRGVVVLYQMTVQHRNAESGKMTRLFAEQSCEDLFDILRLLALPYADHPDYQPEWKP